MGTCSRPVRRNVFNDAIGHEGSVGHIESDPNNGSVRAIEADADDIATGVGHAANLDALKAWGKHSSHLPFRLRRITSAEFYDLLAGQRTPVGEHQLSITADRPLHLDGHWIGEFSTNLFRESSGLNYQRNTGGLKHGNLQ